MARHLSPDVPSVLLVDSAPDDRAMYAEYLRICGCNPIEIDNTADALSGAMKADVIVTGIRVEGPFDGIELVRRLRAENGTQHKPIIVLTACAFEPDQQGAGGTCSAVVERRKLRQKPFASGRRLNARN